MNQLNLPYGLLFKDLYDQQGLQKLDKLFLENLTPEISSKLSFLRTQPQELLQHQNKEFLIDLARHCEEFIINLFGLNQYSQQQKDYASAFEKKYQFKRNFIQRKSLKKYSPEDVSNLEKDLLLKTLQSYLGGSFDEDAFIHLVQKAEKDQDQEKIDFALKYCAWASLCDQGQRHHSNHFLFKNPKNIDPLAPFPFEVEKNTSIKAFDENLIHRDGFDCTHKKNSTDQILDQAHYCIKCHVREKDFCSIGLPQQPDKSGCPLDVKVSEMNLLHQQGLNIASLAVIMVDNPMVAATGERICNDCRKSCIFQKQTSVDVPSIETAILDQVLSLPWGFEVYSLLSRWNPLSLKAPYPSENTGKSVLIVGMGPAGFTLAHHLLNAGHQVIAIDALKINPLDKKLKNLTPIYNVQTLYQPLSEREIDGFGGVAEYGITARWDKNYLKLIRIILERRHNFHLYGGIRFGSQITSNQAKTLGIDHIAICAGAGQPNLPKIKNVMAKGVRFASDFLMNLQLTGAYKDLSPSNLQIRLPIVVIGGGLTAIDTATEALAFYPIQVERFLKRYEELVDKQGRETVRKYWSKEEGQIADEFLVHAKAIRKERKSAKVESRLPRINQLLNQWGGAKIVYRNDLSQSPSFKINPEELFKALQEGIQFIPNCAPDEIVLDEFGYACGLKVLAKEKLTTLKARSLFIATGTKSNQYTLKDGIPHQNLPQGEISETFLPQDPKISFHGDIHSSYAGSVVKAMASAKKAAPQITLELVKTPAISEPDKVAQSLKEGLTTYVHHVHMLSPGIIEIIVKSPFAAANFLPGQFFRFQTYSASNLPNIIDGIALSGTSVDKTKGLISLIFLQKNNLNYLLKNLKPGTPLVLMGPTGSPTEIVENQNVILLGGGLGNAILFSVGKALREKGCKVIYFAAYQDESLIFKSDQVQEAADHVIWCLEEKPKRLETRLQDIVFQGKITNAFKAYADKQFIDLLPFEISEADRLISIGPNQMMESIHKLKQSALQDKLKPNLVSIAAINSPMQCMMKEICGQCIQRQINPETGEEKHVFSCTQQDQDSNFVDFNHLSARLDQNSLMKKFLKQWFEYKSA